MERKQKIKERILSQPSYWIEAINGQLYNAITSYMEKKDWKRKDMAKHLGISRGRMSQILNDDINFSVEKMIKIALKVDVIPDLKFLDKDTYIKKKTAVDEVEVITISYSKFNQDEVVEADESSSQVPSSSSIAL